MKQPIKSPLRYGAQVKGYGNGRCLRVFCNDIQTSIIGMKLVMHEPLLILKVFVKIQIKPTKETRYMGCRSNAIMDTHNSPKIPFFQTCY